jgi:hypothetical protein
MDKVVYKNFTKVVLDKDKYEEDFAKELANNGFRILEAYNSTYNQVNKIRASNMLRNTSVWERFFTNLEEKKNKNNKEKEWLNEYNRCIDLYGISPFELYDIHVQIHPKTNKPLIYSIGNDPIKDTQILFYLAYFMSLIERVKWVDDVQKRILEEYDLVKDDPDFIKSIKHFTKMTDIDMEDILNKIENNG